MTSTPSWLRPARRGGERLVRRGLRRLGYELIRPASAAYPPDFSPALIALCQQVGPYTLTSHERVAALVEAVTYVSRAGIDGAIVECGVWRGGSMLAVAKTLVGLGDVSRDLYLFDTFDTMPPPGPHDVDYRGVRAADFFDAALAHPGFAYLPQGEVEDLIRSTGYPADHLHFVRGMVEETIPARAPAAVSLCRLDTDWYDSTAHEMRHLFPRIAVGGVLLVDDYGHLLGSKKAVDEYFAEHGLVVLLQRIDFTGRLVLVTGEIAAQVRSGGVGPPPPSPRPRSSG